MPAFSKGAFSAAITLVSLSLAGCNSLGAPEAPAPAVAPIAGAAVAAPPPGAKPVKVAEAKPPEQTPDGVLAGSFGAKLGEGERKTAFAAQLDALTTGQRKTWRGAPGGAYGYIEPGIETPGLKGSCRSYNQTIYFAGRPQTASGQSCREPDGVWRAA